MKNIDRLIGIVFILIAVIFFTQTFELPENSQTYPRFLIGIMAFLALLIMINSFFSSKGKTWKELFGHIQWKRFTSVFVMSLLYLVLMNILGYFSSTIIYLLAILFTLKGSRMTIIISVPLFTVGIYIIFKMFLKVPLPTGILI